MKPDQRDRTGNRKFGAGSFQERGNIVLISALLVLSMGAMGIFVSRLISSQLNIDANLRLSNYGGLLAQYVADSGINSLLYYWNTRQVPAPNQPASYPSFPSVTATYSIPGGSTFTVTSTATYSITISGMAPGPYTVVSNATVNTPSAGSGWQSISRRVTVTIASGSQYVVTSYQR